MKITFRRSGGFAPMPIICEIDTTGGGADAAECQRLIETSGIMSATSAQVAGARDVHYYHIEIVDGTTVKRVNFDQISVPPAIKPLIDFLIKRSKSFFDDD
jgi:hypothetical protein